MTLYFFGRLGLSNKSVSRPLFLLYCKKTTKKNKAFMLIFSAKAFVMSWIFSKFVLQVNC